MPLQSIKPFLKWCGGKRRLVSKISANLPAHIGTYYEPFLGGGAVFFELARQRRFDRAVIGDKCPDLMDAYQTVRDDIDGLVDLLKQPLYVYDRQSYLSIRSMDPNRMDQTERAARTIYLNHTCFNGLYRVNKSGKFNTPFGKYVNPKILDEENLRACSAALNMAELAEGDFEDICTDAGLGDAVYFDPPYMPTSKTSKFTQYTPNGFSRHDHTRLAKFFRELDGRGVSQALSNSANVDVPSMFSGFRIETIVNPCSMADPDRRKSVPEILVDNMTVEP
jgi:DNA adenine methylase